HPAASRRRRRRWRRGARLARPGRAGGGAAPARPRPPGGGRCVGARWRGAPVGAAPAAGQLGDDRARGVVIVVLPLVRATHVGAFKDGGHAKTPNLNDLTGRSLRANRAIPESMPAVSTRRALVTGMRAF